jgi:hypothetical protein
VGILSLGILAWGSGGFRAVFGYVIDFGEFIFLVRLWMNSEAELNSNSSARIGSTVPAAAHGEAG